MKDIKKILVLLAFTITAYLAGFFDITEQIYPDINCSFSSSTCPDSIIFIVKDFNDPNIYIKAGNERFGLRHIILRHLNSNYNYFYNEDATKFPNGTDTMDIIEGIMKVYRYGERTKSSKPNNYAYQKQIDFNGEEATYRLIIRKCDNSVVTFYKRENSEILD